MTAQTLAIGKTNGTPSPEDSSLRGLCLAGAAAAVLVVLAALAEILITFLPGGYTSADTVTGWFALLQTQPLLGLRNLGLINIVMIALGIPLIFCLYMLHRDRSPSLAALAALLSMIGTAVFYATNRAFPLLDLSIRYTAAPAGQRAALEAAGQALLAVGQSHTPGTFLAFFYSEVAGVLMGVVMLRGRLFHPAVALSGMAAYGLLLVHEILTTFIPSAHSAALLPAMLGGILNIAWYLLAARRLFQIARRNDRENRS